MGGGGGGEACGSVCLCVCVHVRVCVYVLPCFLMVCCVCVSAQLRSHKTRNTHTSVSLHTRMRSHARARLFIYFFLLLLRARGTGGADFHFFGFCVTRRLIPGGRAVFAELLHACAPAEWLLTLSCSLSFSSYRDNFGCLRVRPFCGVFANAAGRASAASAVRKAQFYCVFVFVFLGGFDSADLNELLISCYG